MGQNRMLNSGSTELRYESRYKGFGTEEINTNHPDSTTKKRTATGKRDISRSLEDTENVRRTPKEKESG